MKTYSIGVRDIPQISQIGEKVYAIHQWNSRTFSQKCPVCDGEKKITYRRYELPCPYCVAGMSTSTNGKPIVRDTITMYAFEVEEYIVNHIEIEGPDLKKTYSASERGKLENMPKIKCVAAFTRRNSGCNGTATILVRDGIFLDPDDDKVINVLRMSDYSFTTRKKAEHAVDLLVEREKKRLAVFNEKFGCSYEYPEE